VGAPGLNEAERGEQIAIVQLEVDRLKRLFDNLMAMASVDAQALHAQLEWVHPIDIVDAARQQARGPLAGHPVTVVDQCDGVVFHLDPLLTSAALAHVLENAAGYSPDGAAIDLDLLAGRDGLTICVRDRGPGLRADERERIFDRFFRGTASATERFSSGMGLSITRGLLQTQQGQISAGNHPDGGAIFRLTIPAAPRDVADVSTGAA
jgi:two-component system sensor histidine kinase KdpD